MNILQLSKYYPPIKGGIETVAQMFSRAHQKINDKIYIISFGKEKSHYQGEYSEEVFVIKEDLFFISTPFNFKFYFNFLDYVKKYNINKIYIHLPNPFMHETIRKYAKLLKAENLTLAAIYHSDIVNQKMLGPIYNKYFSYTSNLYDEFICSSKQLYLSSKFLSQLPREKLKIIPFCIKGNNPFRLRKTFKNRLVTIGRLVPYKGIEPLIKAINKTNYHLTIIGNGPLLGRLKSIAGKNIAIKTDVSDEVKFKILHESDLFIMSSINRAEAYGMVIVEAFENGLPVIASNIPTGVTYLVTHKTRGMLFTPNNTVEMLKRINEVKNNLDLFEKMSRNCRLFYEKELSFSAFAERIKNKLIKP